MNKHTIRTRTTMFAAGLAAVAVGGATTTALLMEGSGPAVAAVHHRSSSHDPSMVGVSDPALRAAHVAHSEVIRGEGTAHRVTVSRDKAFGGSQLGESHSGAQADKATQVHMQITNNTHETLDLTSATDSGSGSHWQDRATDLAPGATETVSNYAAGDAQINLTFTGATTGAVFKLAGETPLVGSNSASGSSSSTSYIAQASAGSGYNPTDSYSIQPGQTFSYTGQTTTYTVPPGVTQLSVAAAGGAGGDTAVLEHEPNGAEVKGDLAVTPGEVLTLGVGGHGSCMYNALGGGWGLTSGSDNYSGGNGASSGEDSTCPGGGATVVLDSSNNVALVAGGGGGAGAPGTGSNGQNGGRGGYNGVWAGEDGFPYVGGGGKAGANSTTQGEEVTSAGGLSGGAGGGGANGGMAGLSGGGAGGGAGGSSAPGLTNATVETAPAQSGNVAPGFVTFTPVG